MALANLFIFADGTVLNWDGVLMVNASGSNLAVTPLSGLSFNHSDPSNVVYGKIAAAFPDFIFADGNVLNMDNLVSVSKNGANSLNFTRLDLTTGTHSDPSNTLYTVIAADSN